MLGKVRAGVAAASVPCGREGGLGGAVRPLGAGGGRGANDARDGGDLIEPAFATALETVPPAQRRVLQVLMTTILEQLASKDGP